MTKKKQRFRNNDTFTQIDVKVGWAVVDPRRDGVPHVDGETTGSRLVRNRTDGLERHLLKIAYRRAVKQYELLLLPLTVFS
jgi:hypothetical protein